MAEASIQPGRYGPFHRIQSPTQDAATAVQQVETGEIWGREARGSSRKSVKAYRGSLPEGESGIEFYTDVAPHPNFHPMLVQWYEGENDVADQGDYVAIAVRLTKVHIAP